MPPEESPTDLTSIAVAIGNLQTRVEMGFEQVTKSIDGLTEASNNHGDTLARHEVDIQLLKANQPKRTPWYQTWGIIIAAITVVVTIGGVIVALVQVANALNY